MALERELVIRPYGPDDAAEAVMLWYRTWHHTFPQRTHPRPRAEWPARLAELAVTESVWIAEVGTHIVAFMALREQDGYVHLLYVTPDSHSRGVGTALLARARALCPRGIWLHCMEENAHARAFYERRGFTPGATGINQNTAQPEVEYRLDPAPAG